jgi:hypothetical protein
MSIYPTGRDKPGRASFTPEKEKPGTGPGFGNNTNSEVQYSPLPKYRPAAQLLTQGKRVIFIVETTR